MTPRARAVAWFVALVAATAAAVYLATAPPPHAPAHHGDANLGHGALERLVPVPLEELSGITIHHRGEAREFLRDADGRWLLHGERPGHRYEPGHHAPGAAGDGGNHAHAPDPRQAGVIARAFAMFAVTRIERVVATDGAQQRFGTAVPEMLIMVFRAGDPRPLRRILVGDVAPDGLGRYVLLQDEGTTVIVPDYQIANLVSLLAQTG